MFRPKSESVSVGVESVLVPCRNGLTFGENQSVTFEINRNLGFANLKNARLLTSIKVDTVNNSTAAAYVPDRIAGAQIFIKRCTIRSNGVVLEELNNYNLYAKLYNSASWDVGCENRRTRLEGCMKSNRIQDSPYHVPNRATAEDVNVAGIIRSVERQVEIPILGGIFQNNTAFPLMAMPLEVEIILAKATEVLNVLDLGDNINCDDIGAGAAQATINLKDAQVFAIAPYENTTKTLAMDPDTNLNYCFPWKVGQNVRLTATNQATCLTADAISGALTIASMQFVKASGRYTLTLSGNVNILNQAVSDLQLHSVNTSGAILQGNTPNPPNYRWSNPRLVIPKVVPPPKFAQAMAESIQKGNFSLDVVSYIDYMTAVDGNNTSSTNIIPADLSRVKAIISVPVDQSNRDSLISKNAMMGGYMGAESYQFQINNNLQPDRLVDLKREGHNAPADENNYNKTVAVPPWALGSNVGAVHVYELEKALGSANIPMRNLTFITKTAKQDGCWALARSLGPYGTSANLMGISSILYLNYDGSNTNLKVIHNYVSHIRTFNITPSGVLVSY